MRSHEVTTVQRLLNTDGAVREPGWSRQLLQIYDREDIRANKVRIKEWDYYNVLCDDYAVAFTVADNGYFGLAAADLFEFRGTPHSHSRNTVNLFPMGKLHMPSTSAEGTVRYESRRIFLEFVKSGETRHIACEMPNFLNGETLTADITLAQPPMDTMVIATPWKEDKKAFYYNQKINCMRADGYVKVGSRRYDFSPDSAFATLDWGRGVWTHNNTWRWGSGNGVVNGKLFGFNIGYGFADTSAASENLLIYDGVGHKLDDIRFHIPKSGYTDPWIITSSDGRFEMDFVPIYDHAMNIDALLLATHSHQVFGRMSGTAVLDGGEKLNIKDLVCFCEKVHNKY